MGEKNTLSPADIGTHVLDNTGLYSCSNIVSLRMTVALDSTSTPNMFQFLPILGRSIHLLQMKMQKFDLTFYSFTFPFLY